MFRSSLDLDEAETASGCNLDAFASIVLHESYEAAHKIVEESGSKSRGQCPSEKKTAVRRSAIVHSTFKKCAS